MSGILGIFSSDGSPVARETLETMLRTLKHRGPDGTEYWHEGVMGMGSRRLRTMSDSARGGGLSTERDGELAVVADARLDNREDLARDLGVDPRGVSDPTLLLQSYARWGERCVERLLGDFAFALWDRGRHRLFCARDHLGVKPFYYVRSPRAFAFSSEIKTLLPLPGVSHHFNERRIADFLLARLDIDTASTFYRDVSRLPPGHTLTVGTTDVRVAAYWSLDPMREIRMTSDAAYADAFRSIFFDAVRCRLQDVDAPGAFLSGGLDSSSIVCAAARVRTNEERPLHTFSAVFPDLPAVDETTFIRAVQAHTGSRVLGHAVRADMLNPLPDHPPTFDADEPLIAPNIYLTWALQAEAKRNGVRVLLDGFDGDTVVSYGIAALAEHVGQGRLWAAAQNARAMARISSTAWWPIFLRCGVYPHVPWMLRAAWRQRRFNAHDATLLRPTFARAVGVDAAEANLAAGEGKNPPRTEREAHWRKLTCGLLPLALDLLDHSAAAFAIEPRYPFFDRRLVEFCLALPPEQKLAHGWTRSILRRALAGVVPDAVRWRTTKSNLSPAFTRQFLAHERARLERLTGPDATWSTPYVDLSRLRERVARYVARPNQDDATTIWLVCALTRWLQDGPHARARTADPGVYSSP